MDVSVVIPAFEEGRKIARYVEAAAEFLQANRLEGEVIVVDDGSEEDTAEAARKVRVPAGVTLNVMRYEQLSDEVRALSRRLGLDPGFELPRSKSHTRKDRRSYREVLEPEERETISRRCSREIELFGYEF